MDATLIKSYYREHEDYWKPFQPELRKLNFAYRTRYWQKDEDDNNNITIETSRGYEFVESYIASLYSKAPSVVVRDDIRGLGNSFVVQYLCNNFLRKSRKRLEDASRLAIIYPCSFLKLVPKSHKDPFKRVRVESIPCWDVIVDCEAQEWEDVRFVGHRYWISKKIAMEKYGKADLQTHAKKSYLDNDEGDQGYNKEAFNAVPDEFQYIEVIEMYNLEENTLHIWSPDYMNGEELLSDGVTIQVGSKTDPKEIKYSGIPFKDETDTPISPIVPLYFSRLPDEPMRGYSGLRRVYDQIKEINTGRTYQASMVRRSARQWLVEKGVIDDDTMSKIAQGVDGEYFEVDIPAGKSLRQLIEAVPHTPVPAEIGRHLKEVQEDFERGSVLAPFTRGESSRATATEITALSAYSSSEIGRLARERDDVIESLSKIYISILKLYIEDEGDSIIINNEPTKITSSDLKGDFTFFANDSGSTPISTAVKKQEFMSVLPTLMQFQVDPTKLLTHLIQLMDLPQSFLAEMNTMGQNPQEEATSTEAQVQDSTGLSEAEPSSEDIQQFLPQG